ncbi:MAG: DNA alkylation repair protein, partial [Erysipelotrichaceae bacterium]|nr:DNA alkylation repair protein [Erysipelotrichaceae bacterium]
MPDCDSVRKTLLTLVDEPYREFHAHLIPGMNNNLGIRTPQLRKLAKQIAKDEGLHYLNHAPEEYYEEILLEGMVIGYVNCDVSSRLEAIEAYLPKIDNWATCDMFVSTLKFTKKQQQVVWDWLQPFVFSTREFEVRFAIVMILSYYLYDPYLDLCYSVFDQIKHQGYYVKMALAWAVSIAYIKEPERTLIYLQHCKLDDWTFHKAIQKIRESHRVNDQQKALLQ